MNRILPFVAVFASLVGAPARADDNVCTLGNGPALALAADALIEAPGSQPALIYAYSRIPVGGPMQIAVADTPMPAHGEQAGMNKIRVLVSDIESLDAARSAAEHAARLDMAATAAEKEAADAMSRAQTLAAAAKTDSSKQADAKDAADTANDDAARATAARARAGRAGASAKEAARTISASFVQGLAVTPSAAAADNTLVKATRITVGTLLLDFTVPSPWVTPPTWVDLWAPGVLTVIACDKDNNATFASSLPTTLSNAKGCGLVAAVVTLLMYVLVALAACEVENKARKAADRKDGSAYLDPVMLTSGPDGRGSVSRLQILMFTVLLFYILLFLLLRIGLLSDMSNTVLLLLGISAVGAAASKGTDVQVNRLSGQNWAWLASQGWLPRKGLGATNTAHWRDLVTADDGFDVYHFQMLIFSVVVAVALLQVGFTDLAHFEVPESLLGVLGLSQAVYVGGKFAAPPSYGDLDKMLDDLQRLKADLLSLQVAFDARVAAGLPNTPDQVAALAVARAAAQTQLDKVKVQFASVFAEVPEACRQARQMATI